MTSERDSIKMAALAYGAGDVFRMVCPFCNAQHEHSMRVCVYPDKIVYNCYRAKCTAIGAIGGKYNEQKKKGFKAKFCKENMSNLPLPLIDALIDKYEINGSDSSYNGFRWLPQTKRLYMPVYSHTGAPWGAVAKQWKYPDKKPKTVLFRHTDSTTGLHYPYNYTTRGGPLVICEDILSSVKLSHLMKSVALLGTYMSDEMAVELARQSNTLYLFLDNDAVDKAVKIRKKYAALGDWRIIINDKDPKDTPYQRLEELFSGELITSRSNSGT